VAALENPVACDNGALDLLVVGLETEDLLENPNACGDLDALDLLDDMEATFDSSLFPQNNSGLPDNQEEEEKDAF
jgi:hypothetical protein